MLLYHIALKEEMPLTPSERILATSLISREYLLNYEASNHHLYSDYKINPQYL